MIPCRIVLNNTLLILIQCSRWFPGLLSHVSGWIPWHPVKPHARHGSPFGAWMIVNPRALKALTVKKTTCAPRRCMFPLGPPRYCRVIQGSMQVSSLPSPIVYIYPSRKNRWRKMDRLVSWHFILSELVSTQQRYNMWHNLLRAYDVSSNLVSFKPCNSRGR